MKELDEAVARYVEKFGRTPPIFMVPRERALRLIEDAIESGQPIPPEEDHGMPGKGGMPAGAVISIATAVLILANCGPYLAFHGIDPDAPQEPAPRVECRLPDGSVRWTSKAVCWALQRTMWDELTERRSGRR